MATLKAVDINKLTKNMNKLKSDFKLIKKLIRQEIELNQGSISYDRVEQYDDLILHLKKANIVCKSLIEDEDLVNLQGNELTVFCNKIHLDEDNFFKYQILVQRIDDFNLNKYIKAIQKELETTIVQEQNEQIENLEIIAYKDKLTGLYNRAIYEEVLNETIKTSKFCVIFLDLNDLKKTNDTLGHEYGDKLIKCFTKILNKARTGEEEIYRIGGDEFVILFEKSDKNKPIEFINSFNHYSEKHNKESSIKVSSAYGIACACDEQPSLSIQEIIKIADDRMYKMKKEKKMGR
jgi:diguanylate cyclase (GGDEF)-like protein